MDLKNYVPGIELCKKWKDIGGNQDTEFDWVFRYGEWVLWGSTDWSEFETGAEKDYVSAPISDELLEWFKNDIECIYFQDKIWIVTRAGSEGDKFRSNRFASALLIMGIMIKEEEQNDIQGRRTKSAW